MGLLVQSALVSAIVLLSIMSLDALPVKTRVVVQSLSDKIIRIHCRSTEDDLGVHDLAYQQYFSWHFKPNIWGSTKFDCDILTAYGSGYYNVYDDDKDLVCSPECVWEVTNSGPCLLSNPSGKVFCQQFQKKPNRPSNWKLGAQKMD